MTLIVVGIYLKRPYTDSYLNIKIKPTRDYKIIKKYVKEQFPGWQFTDYEIVLE